MANILERMEGYLDASAVVRNAETYYPEYSFSDRSYIMARRAVLDGETAVANIKWLSVGILVLAAMVTRSSLVRAGALLSGGLLAYNALNHEIAIADGRHKGKPLTRTLSL